MKPKAKELRKMYSYMNPVSRVYQTNPYMNQNARQHSQEAQPKAEKPQENVLHQGYLYVAVGLSTFSVLG